MTNRSSFFSIVIIATVFVVVGGLLSLNPTLEQQSQIVLTQAIEVGAVLIDEPAQNRAQITPTLTPSPTATTSLSLAEITNASLFIDLNSSSPDSDAISPLSDTDYVSDVITVPDINPEPYLHFGSVWHVEGVLLDTGIVTISIRDSIDGETWNAWQDYDHLHLLENGNMYGHLLTFPPETGFLQFRIHWNNLDLRINANITGVELAFINSGATPTNLTQQFQQTNETGAFVTMSDPQPVISRTQWGCPQGQNSPEWQPSYTTVTHLIVHHTVSSNSITDWAANVRAIWDYHTNTLDWGDIGYNYLIDPNGVIYEGRAGGDGSVGAHFSCFNSRTVGVAMLGTFSSVAPTNNALRSLERLLAWKAGVFGITPLASSWHSPSALSLMNISGHRDGNSSQYGCPGGTVCPGNVLYSLLPSIRNNVNSLVQIPPTATPTFTPTMTFTPTNTPTPTITPVGYTIAQINESEFLDALQRSNNNDSMRIALVIFRDARIQIYIEINGVTGIATINPIWGLNFVMLQIDSVVNVNATVPLSASVVQTINSSLPVMMVDALDLLLAQRFETTVDAENIIISGNMMLLGVIEPD